MAKHKSVLLLAFGIYTVIELCNFASLFCAEEILLLDQFKTLLTQKGIPEFSFSGQYYFAGLQGSSINFIISSVFKFTPKTILLIVRDREEALYRLNDIQHLNPNAHVFFFPASAKIPYNEERTINASRQERSEVLSFLSSGVAPSIIISTAEAISEKVVSNDNMKARVFEVSLKEKISLDFFSEYLNDSGFERVEFVAEPGQYAIRGGLLDVFSFSSDEPNRVLNFLVKRLSRSEVLILPHKSPIRITVK